MDEQKIMIDNVDVSECEHVCVSTSLFKEKTYVKCSAFFLENEDSCCECSDNPNCYYKQLKRKEQEYEILNIEIEDIAEARMEICNQCEERDDYNIPCKQIRDLDYGLKLEIEENEKLKQTLAEIKKIAEILAPMTDEYENCYDRDRCFECDFTEDCSYFNTKRIIQICDEAINE